MSHIRKFAVALIALTVIASAVVATDGIEVLKPGIEVLGIEVLSPNESIAHVMITDAPNDPHLMVFGVWSDGINEHVVSTTPVMPDGLTSVYFPMQSPSNKIVLGYMTADGIEVLATSGTGLHEGIWELD